MIKRDELTVLEDKMKALDPEHKDVCTFLGCQQGDKTDVKRVIERVNDGVQKRTEQLVKLKVNDTNMMKAINCRMVPAAGYATNVCLATKNDLAKLDKIVRSILRNEGFHGKKVNDERLCKKGKDGVRGLRSFTQGD